MPDSADGFINPYTFVPSPRVGAEFCGEPAGHGRLGDGGLMGKIEVTLTAKSPLLVRDGDGKFPQRTFEPGDPAVPFLPGSGLAGAFRAVHESLVGGCLRVFDDEVEPTYRDQPSPLGSEWRLARVVEVTGDGLPKRIRLCSRYDKVEVGLLAAALGGVDKVETGALIDVHQPGQRKGQSTQRQGKPRKITSPEPLRPGGDECVILMTDSGARAKEKPYMCVVGRLSGTELSWRDETEFEHSWKPAWRTFRKLIGDTDDTRLARSSSEADVPKLDDPQQGPVRMPVHFPPDDPSAQVIGYRHAVQPVLCEGQVLWVLPGAGGGVAEFRTAQVWRHRGSGHAGKRVPEELLPCGDPANLCPTCRVWGSACENDESRGGAAEQHSYRGHLRISDGVPVGEPPEPVDCVLPPLGTPRPGAGQFYLERTEPFARADGERPLREWGSAADPEPPRMLRGRKHYWLTQEAKRRPYFRLADGAGFDPDGNMASRAQYLRKGARFTCTVTFGNLDQVQLGGLLAALEPSLVLTPASRNKRIGMSVGGGKPLGFGSCVTEVTGLTVHHAESWYGEDTAPVADKESFVAAFREQADAGVQECWPALAAALTLDRVPPRHVWYPATDALGNEPLSADDLAPGFEFWKQSIDLPGHLVLPDVLAENQVLLFVEPEPDKPGKEQR